jgi:hypothetical protein
MKRNLIGILITLALLTAGAIHAHSQTINDPEVNKLKDEIQRRAFVEQDPAILPEDKQVNRVNLEKARSNLSTLLKSRIQAKTKLKEMLGPSIAPEERDSIDASVRSLEADLQALQRQNPFAPATTTSNSNSNPAEVNATNSSAVTPSSANTATPSVTNNPPTSFVPPISSPPRTLVPAPITTAGTDVLPIRKCTDVQQNLATASNLEKFFCARVAVIQRDKHIATPINGLDLRRDFFFFMITLLAREGRAQYIVAAENERVDKQAGSSASSSGSTSLVSKGSVPGILGFATDSGAFLKSISGSTVTFRGNVTGVAKALAGKGFISGYDEDSPAARFFRRTSFSFSFDATRGSSPGIFTGDKQQISNYSFRMDLYNKRDGRDSRYKQAWDDFLSNQSEALVAQTQTSLLALANPSTNTWNDAALQDWYVLADSAIRAADGLDQVDAVLREQLKKAPTNLAATTVAELRSFDKKFKAWLDTRETILDKIATAPIVTFEYINDRPENASSLSTFNLIAEGGFGPRLDLTFNGSITVFNKRSPVAGQGRVRDFQFATQLDVPFGEIGGGIGKPVLSFAGRYESLQEDATTAGGIVAPNTKGGIGVGQIKFTIPVKNTGIRIPLSFSFANRTELIKEKEVRGNFGFSFDPDVLFALFKPFTQR